ncbi:hypothetical protein TUM4438_00430 [Shewanella sairae]|uniref:Uncharacterized protein n=1 Tax=Shewanella sairae TaxID=190310 RepID=A0ABQ4NYP9_9GAMM|nr:hypothetical protein [Shewanella sairae]MCL1131711.1 hypothetical protein [Shewanella sairae]GIU40095.1 hypothetical protein TUM4438_00430 [Shewanella sairae]
MEIVKLRCTLFGIAWLSFASTANDEALTRANSLSEQAQKITLEVEQEQLQKARDAAKQTQEREQKVLKRQESGDWESEQIEKAQQQFKQRESREEKYLREAREAANKQHKIPQPIKP